MIRRKITGAGDERIYGTDIPLDGQRCQGFNEGSLLRNPSFTAIFAQRDRLAHLISEVACKVRRRLPATARISALSWLELKSFGRFFVANLAIVLITRHVQASER